MRRQTKILLARRGIFALLILAAYLVQRAVGGTLEFFGVRAWFLLTFTVCLGLIERGCALGFCVSERRRLPCVFIYGNRRGVRNFNQYRYAKQFSDGFVAERYCTSVVYFFIYCVLCTCRRRRQRRLAVCAFLFTVGGIFRFVHARDLPVGTRSDEPYKTAAVMCKTMARTTP